MAKNFWTILLAIGYVILFVALLFIVISDNFYSYKEFGTLKYFAFVPFGYFVICVLSIYSLLIFMRFLSPKTSASLALGFTAYIGFISVYTLWVGNPFFCGIHHGFLIFMRVVSVVFIAGTPAIFFACAMSLLMAARTRRAWVMFGLSALVFAYLCIYDLALMSISACAATGAVFSFISLFQWWKRIEQMRP